MPQNPEKTELDQCWENQLRLSGHIADSGVLGSRVLQAKQEWLKSHGFKQPLHNYCFFCQFSVSRKKDSCSGCPAKLVDADFTCMDSRYDFSDKPKEFCAEIVRLNEKRKEQDAAKPNNS